MDRLERNAEGSILGEKDLFSPQNPFVNPYILEMLLTFLPIVDLHNCRFVSSSWNNEIQRFLKKTKTVCILAGNFEPAEQLLAEKSKGNDVYLSKMECRNSNCSDPFFDKLILRMGIHIHKLAIYDCELNVNAFQCLLLSDPFPNLYSLILNHTSYNDSQGRQTIFSSDEESHSVLNSLKKLEINERGPNSQTSLKSIALMCPNLKSLAFGNCPCPNVADFSNSDTTLSLLEYLQLAPIDGKKMTFEYFQTLTYLKMTSLKTVFLYGMDPGGSKRMKNLKNFLKSVSATLDSLHMGQRIMYSPEYKSGVASPFPVSLPNLKRMSIGPGFINSIKFLNKLPNLMSFTCARTKSGDWTKIVMKGSPNPHNAMRILDLGDVNHIPLQKLGPCFPNLTKLELNLSRVENHDQVVRAIFGNFPKLQTFSFYDLSNENRLTDSGITGIPNESSSQLSTKNPESLRKFPYIGNLKYLIDLRLQYLGGQLTDASVAYGIKDVPCLYALDLSNSQITDSSLDIIANCCPALTMLYIRNCSNVTPEGRTRFEKMRTDVKLRFQM